MADEHDYSPTEYDLRLADRTLLFFNSSHGKDWVASEFACARVNERERVLAAVLAWHTSGIDAHPSLDGRRAEAQENGERMVRQLRAVLEKS